jgi:hypothetical protein
MHHLVKQVVSIFFNHIILRLGTVFLCAACGGGVLVVLLNAYHIVFFESALSRGYSLRNLLPEGIMSFLGICLGASIVSLSYLYMVLLYVLVLRKIVDFWRALPRCFLTIFLSISSVCIASFHTIGLIIHKAGVFLIAPHIGFWIGIYILWIHYRKQAPER